MAGFASGIMSRIKRQKADFEQAGNDAVEAAKSISTKKTMIDQALGRPGAFRSVVPETPAQTGGAPIDRIKPGAKFGDRSGEKRINTEKMRAPLGSFKKGGKVKKTGVYKLHAKERVLNAKQTAKMEMMEKSGLMKGLSRE